MGGVRRAGAVVDCSPACSGAKRAVYTDAVGDVTAAPARAGATHHPLSICPPIDVGWLRILCVFSLYKCAGGEGVCGAAGGCAGGRAPRSGLLCDVTASARLPPRTPSALYPPSAPYPCLRVALDFPCDAWRFCVRLAGVGGGQLLPPSPPLAFSWAHSRDCTAQLLPLHMHFLRECVP
jgi:hypothetical protein